MNFALRFHANALVVLDRTSPDFGCGGRESSQALQLSTQPGNAARHGAARPRPTDSCATRIGHATRRAVARIMSARAEDLIARDPPHGFGCQRPKRRAAAMPGDRFRHVHSAETVGRRTAGRNRHLPDTIRSAHRAARPCGRIRRETGRRSTAAKQMRRGDGKCGPSGRPLPTRQAQPPRQTRSKVPSMQRRIRRLQNLSGGEPGVVRRRRAARSQSGASSTSLLRTAIQSLGRFADAAIHGAREARIRPMANDARPALLAPAPARRRWSRCRRSAISASGLGLRVAGWPAAVPDQLAAVPHRHDRRLMLIGRSASSPGTRDSECRRARGSA